MKQLLLDNSYVHVELEDGIIAVTWKNTNVDIETAQQMVKDRLAAVGGRPSALLADVRSMLNISKEAREYLASEKGCEGVYVCAVVIGSSIGSMMGNVFISINRPLVPTKLFTDIESARKWLAKFVEIYKNEF